ncbi:MAG: hypothetical protein E7L43_00680 [Finegoldia magna]|nr:hypothetical protein [Finegoldia magna]
MSYDGKINRKLRTVELNDDECIYKLAYDEEKRRYFKRKDILNYVNEHYLENDNIIEENLLNDLNTFKTYRDDVEITEKNWDIFQGIITIYVALFNDVFKSETADFMRLCYILIILAISIVIYLIRTCKHSNYYKLKFITNAIYTLETIKEDMCRNGNSGIESDEIISSVNDKLDDGNTEDISTEDANERYEGLELTEVKEIRTYAYKATKNKYSPRAMYEKKRR